MTETLDLMRLWMAESMGEAYFRRDPIAVITVQGAGAKLLVHPTPASILSCIGSRPSLWEGVRHWIGAC